MRIPAQFRFDGESVDIEWDEALDALLSAVLIKLFSDRQLAVPSNLIPYLVLRIERSIAAARARGAGSAPAPAAVPDGPPGSAGSARRARATA